MECAAVYECSVPAMLADILLESIRDQTRLHESLEKTLGTAVTEEYATIGARLFKEVCRRHCILSPMITCIRI